MGDETLVTAEIAQTYRKRPVEVEAFLLTEDSALDVLHWIRTQGGHGNVLSGGTLQIVTLEGTMLADLGDYVIRGVQGEFYPCKPDIFQATYEYPAAQPTKWPTCTLNGHHLGDVHVGNEDHSKGSPAWKYVDSLGHATCSCCDPTNGFPCASAPTTPPGVTS